MSGRRKKEEAVIAMVLAVKNVLTVLAVAIDKIRILKSLLDKLSSLSKKLRNQFSMSEVLSQSKLKSLLRTKFVNLRDGGGNFCWCDRPWCRYSLVFQ